jgi:ADP-heptose:LPS heptosyltransferase
VNPASSSVPDWSGIRRLLVVRLDNLGDVVLTGPVLRAVKERRADIHLTLLASPGGAPAAELLPWIDEVMIHRAPWQDLGRLAFDAARERAFVEALRRGHHDAALILTSFSQSPHPAALACALAGIPVRIGQSHERGRTLTFELPNAPHELHQAERNRVLAEAAGLRVRDSMLEIRIPDEARIAARESLAAHGAMGGHLLLTAWASCQARTYDPLRFAAAARMLAEWTNLPVVLCGSARDRDRTPALAAVLGTRGIDLVGRTDACTFAALIADARLVLTNNTATMHLADALIVPQLVMDSGAELQSHWAPRASPHRLLRRPTPCSPCHRFECPTNRECLDFSPEEVAHAGAELLANAH